MSSVSAVTLTATALLAMPFANTVSKYGPGGRLVTAGKGAL